MSETSERVSKLYGTPMKIKLRCSPSSARCTVILETNLPNAAPEHNSERYYRCPAELRSLLSRFALRLYSLSVLSCVRCAMHSCSGPAACSL